ncbi:RNA polymerase sigma-70 factor [Chitinophaga lutea]
MNETSFSNNLEPEALFRKLFHDYFERLHRYAFTILKDNAEASDVVQTVFVRLWEKRRALAGEEGAGSYLYRATHNECLNRLRQAGIRDKYRVERVHAGNGGGHDETAMKTLAGELRERLHEALAALPPQCRLIFMKSREEGKRYAEIAVELGISIKTVEAQMGKALRILREKLSDYLVIFLILLMN